MLLNNHGVNSYNRISATRTHVKYPESTQTGTHEDQNDPPWGAFGRLGGLLVGLEGVNVHKKGAKGGPKVPQWVSRARACSASGCRCEKRAPKVSQMTPNGALFGSLGCQNEHFGHH